MGNSGDPALPKPPGPLAPRPKGSSAASRAYALLGRLGLLPSGPHEPLWKIVLRALPTLVTVSLLMLALEHFGWLKGLETYALDAVLRIQAPSLHTNLVIVTIDDEDYQTLFKGRSPLDTQQVQKILHAVAAGQPRVIGVDLDSSRPEYAQLHLPAAIWGRDAYPAENAADHHQADSHAESHASGHGALELVRLSAVGGQLKETSTADHTIATTPPSGVVTFPQDQDGVVRRYRRVYSSPQSEPPGELAGKVETLSWAIAKKYAEATKEPSRECEHVKAAQKDGEDEELVLNFAGERTRFKRLTARHLLAASKQDYWKSNSPLKDAIVLVGGAFREARDEYPTPVGPRLGVELIAQAIEADLTGRGIGRLHWITALVMDFATSLILLYLNWRFPSRYAVYVNLAAIVVLSLGASFLAFHAVAYWFNFSAVLLGIWVHLLWEQSQELRELRHEVEQLRHEAGNAA